VENNVENAQVIATGLDVVNDVHVVMYNGKLYMEFIVYTVIGLGAFQQYISVISWVSVLLVKEPAVPGENQRPAVSH